MADENTTMGEIEVEPKDPLEQFTGSRNQALTSNTIEDFWQWAYSDIVNNTNRGILAEYIVARALGSEEAVRTNWASWDVDDPANTRVEVKSVAFLQSWEQEQISTPRFGIARAAGYNPDIDDYDPEPQRHSHVYVFCLLAYRGDKQELNPLDLRQWEFYVVDTPRIDTEFGDRKSLSLSQVKRLSRAHNVDELRDAVMEAGGDPLGRA